MLKNEKYRGVYIYNRRTSKDAMGSYSSTNRYSRETKEDMINELHELMEDVPDEKTKSEFHKFISKLDSIR